jgi:hypothetical protein
MSAGHMSYVGCPKCGDAVAGRMPSGDEPRRLTCVHCKTTFEFEDSDRRSGLVEFNEETRRWKVVTLAMTMERNESAPRAGAIRRRRR